MLHPFLDHFPLLANVAEHSAASAASAAASPTEHMTLLQEFGYNFLHNLFKPLLLFFYAGFLIPMLKVKFEFPKVLYQSITIYLLIAIGWHGGEELASLKPDMLLQALGFMVIGFFTNLLIGVLAFGFLRAFTGLRKIDAATVAGYYGSDSAGTFVTCVGVLVASGIAFAAYMPVMLAVMEIPGCLVALVIVARLRRAGMDANGNMPDEAGYDRYAIAVRPAAHEEHGHGDSHAAPVRKPMLVAVGAGTAGGPLHRSVGATGPNHMSGDSSREAPEDFEDDISLQESGLDPDAAGTVPKHSGSLLSKELLHEVFFNPGIYLLFAGILIGFISQLQGSKVTKPDDILFLDLFPPILCLFLLEMGMTASQKLSDLRTAGWKFVAFALIAPNIFATVGMSIAHGYSMLLGVPFAIGTYALFAVLCGAASYIALPAVQRMAIPEASPTLPLAASLGCTFSYNVTIGIPVYILIAKVLVKTFPVAQQVVETAQAAM